MEKGREYLSFSVSPEDKRIFLYLENTVYELENVTEPKNFLIKCAA